VNCSNFYSVCIISIVRLKFLLEVDFEGDLTWTVVEANIWSLLEPTMAVTIGCLPTLAPLFHKILPSKSQVESTPSKPNATPNRRDTKNFHELDDVSPLTQSQITANSNSPGKVPQTSVQHIGDVESGEETDGIRVVTDWEVSRY